MRSRHFTRVICKGFDGGEAPDVPFDVASFLEDSKMITLGSGS